MNISLTNTLTRTLQVFDVTSKDLVKLYVCGITPYDYSHIGHGRVYVSFDLLLRLFRFFKKPICYVRNVTDIDDKLINKALAEHNNIYAYGEVATQFTEYFQQDMQQLNCLHPDHEPRVTECIPEIIQFIEHLINQKHAYVLGHDVYFDISTYKDYGKLSGRKLEDLLAGARVEVNENKKNSGDFALWKGNNEKFFWQSPWGYGRPGWHIECSVMAKQHLGETIDIHAGGMDLIFPHHENEIAQSEALHKKPFARCWVHNAFININKEKMSKSLGNFVTLRSIFQHYDPIVLRFFYLQHHYRTPIDYTHNELDATKSAYKKLVSHLEHIQPQMLHTSIPQDFVEHNTTAQAMLDALCNDLNTPKFLGLVFEALPHLKKDISLANFVKSLLCNVLGLTLYPFQEKTVTITPEIQTLIDAREKARTEKNWDLADKLRDKLMTLGYKAPDKKS